MIDLCILLGGRQIQVEQYRLGRRTPRCAEDTAPLPYSFGGPHCTCQQYEFKFILLRATRTAAVAF